MKRMVVVFLFVFAPLLLPTVAAADGCTYVLGFAALHNFLPSIVGSCVNNEYPGPAGEQQNTSNGLLVWRRADNWTAFTDGYRTYVSGPYGILERLNTQVFSWEANPNHLPIATSPIPITLSSLGSTGAASPAPTPTPTPAPAPAPVPVAVQPTLSTCTVYASTYFYEMVDQITGTNPIPVCDTVQNELQTTGVGGDPNIANDASIACAFGGFLDPSGVLGTVCGAGAQLLNQGNWHVSSGAYMKSSAATEVCQGNYQGAGYVIYDSGSQYVGRNLCAWLQNQ